MNFMKRLFQNKLNIIGETHNEPNKKELIIIFLIGSFIGAYFFVNLFGTKILNFTYVDWIRNQTGQDIFQHQIGFDFFRNSNWEFPIGSYSTYAYPNGTSVVYTDSIPIFAIFFKLIRGILPSSFQYFGLWGLFCFMLQGGFSAVILRKYIANIWIIFSSLPLLIYSPILILRLYGHTALAGHWIILFAIFACVYKNRFKSLKSRVVIWSIITTLCISIHVYFIVMIGVILIGFIMDDLMEYKNFFRAVAIFLCSTTSTIMAFFSIGGFESKGSIVSIGLSDYSMNMNAIFNSNGYSRLLKPLPLAFMEQYEGFEYLGFGVLLLCFLVISSKIISIKKFNLKDILEKIKKNIPVLFVIIVLTILSLSPIITLNSRVLLNYMGFPLVKTFLSPFRATGRLFWPLFYIIIFYVIIYIFRKLKFKNTAVILIALCTIIQFYDIKDLLNSRSAILKSTKIIYQTPLISEFWTQNTYEYAHIEFLSDDIRGYEPIAVFAVENNMTLNNGNIARKNNELVAKNIRDAISQLINGEARKDTIYIMPQDRITDELLFLDDSISILIETFIIDGYYVFIVK